MSGTNVHLILAEPEVGEHVAEDAAAGPGVLGPGMVAWLVSGRSADGLRAQAGRLAAHLAACPGLDPADVGWSLLTTRSVFEHRAVVTGAGAAELAAGLAGLAAGEPGSGVVTGVLPAGGRGKVGFLFSGQGVQRAGMAAELHAASPVFAEAFDQVCELLEAELGTPVRDVVLSRDPADGRANQTLYAQAGLFAIQSGLVALLAGCGIRPDAVAGHSVGEVGAAYAAGVLSLEDACALVAARARLMQALPAGGAMCAIAASEAEVAQVTAGSGGRAVIAAVNGAAEVVVSGEAAAVDNVAGVFIGRGIRTRPLRVSHAFHSPLMEPVLSRLGTVAARLRFTPPQVPWACALTGELLAGCDAGYWVRQVREPVRFSDAVSALAGQEISVFVEIGPDGTLSALGQAILDDSAGTEPVFIPVQRRGQPGPASVLAALARIHVAGLAVDWAAVLGRRRQVELPTSAFARERYWPRPAAAPGDATAAGVVAVGHPLLTIAVELATGEGYLLTGRLSAQQLPWLAEHVMAGATVVPAAALVEMVVRAGDPAGCGRIDELDLDTPLVLGDDNAAQIQVKVGAQDEDGRRAVEVHARAGDGAWTRHASGMLAPAAPPAPGLTEELAVWPPDGATPVPAAEVYAGLAAAGYVYGPAFRGLRAAWRRGADVFAEVVLPEEAAETSGFGLHPALLEAVLHASWLAGNEGLCAETDGEMRLPSGWKDVCVHAAGATVLRARLRPADDGGLSVVAADAAGGPVVSIGSLATRPVAAGQLAAPGMSLDGLLAVEWVPLAEHSESGTPAAGRWAVIGAGMAGLTEELAAAGVQTTAYPDLISLAGADEPLPDVVLADVGIGACGACGAYGASDASGAEPTMSVAEVLGLLQQWLRLERLVDARLVLVTCGAAAVAREGVTDLAGAAVWGLVRSAQAENPGRLVLADLPATDAVGMGAGDRASLLAAAVEYGEPEVAIRGRTVYGRRLARPDAGGLPVPDDRMPWRLEVTGRGTLEDIGLVDCPQADAPLAAGQVRVAVRAAGVNFRDVMIGLGMHPGDAALGGEIAGVVVEAGPRVTSVAAGDRVLGLANGGFGPLAVADARLLAPIPAGWSFAQAAAVPMAFATAWHALVDVAGARAGQKILVHAATGGVGMAAVTIARHLGLEVYATASPGKHQVLAGMGLDEARVASSRTEQFEQRFLGATKGQGMDIVLNSLAGKLTDAGLRLLRSGGVFIELGKSDLRDAAAIARDHPGVVYRAFDLAWANPARIGQILAEVTGLLASGELATPPVRAWDVRRADEALRFMSQARHTGKLVLVIPPDPVSPRRPGTALVTGGTGMLGGLVARHLAAVGQARNVVLTSRSGPAAAGAPRLAADLAGSGAGVRIAACDVTNRDALAGVLAGVPAAHPLTMVVHTAGVVDDGTIGTLTAEQVEAVMRPKADAAWHLHQLTLDADLDGFVLFSSTSAAISGPGQGNYAAANAFLDGLASYRRARGLTAVSMAWGMWSGDGGMAGRLSEGYRTKIARGGMAALTPEKGLALLDAALHRDDGLLVAALLDVAGMRAQAAAGKAVPALWRGLAGGPARSAAAPSAASGTAGAPSAESLRQRLGAMPQAEQTAAVVELVVAQVVAVLGFSSPAQVQNDREFRDLGFDSLTAIELRNALASATGLRLPATLVFDYPTPPALARYLRAEIVQDGQGTALPVLTELDKLESLIAAVDDAQRAQVTARLETLLAKSKAAAHQATGPELSGATAEELFDLIDAEFGQG